MMFSIVLSNKFNSEMTFSVNFFKQLSTVVAQVIFEELFLRGRGLNGRARTINNLFVFMWPKHGFICRDE